MTETETLIRILLVDDDDIDCEALRRLVRKENLPYRLRTAATEAAALDALKNDDFDIVLLDYNLGDTTGLDLLPYVGDIPVIFVTGTGTERIAAEAVGKGAKDYIIKDPERNYLDVLPLTIRNVLTHREAERALAESEQKLRTTLSSISDLVFSLDTDGVFVEYHQPADHPDLIVPPEVFLGKSVHDALPPHLARLLSDAAAKAVAEDGVQKVVYTMEFGERTAWFEAKVSSRRGPEGEPKGVTVVARNITDRKHAEDALQKAHDLLEQRVEERTRELRDANENLRRGEERLRAFLDSSTEGFFLLDADLKFKNINRRALEIMGKTREEVIGENLNDMTPESLTSGRDKIYREVIRTGEPFTVENFTIQSGLGELKGILKAFKVGDGVGIMFIDTTESRRLEEQLRQAQKMEAIGSLAGGIAHDFNNILGIIVGYSELVLDDLPTGSQTRDFIRQVLISSERAKELVAQILAFSRKSERKRTPLLMRIVLEEVLKLLRSTLPTTIDIRTHFKEPLNHVSANSTQMHQVIMNICTNASHAMRGQGGILEITVREDQLDPDTLSAKGLKPGRHQRLSFSDTGHGMPPEVRDRIFEPYYTTKKQGEGTGMGLAVAHGIIKSHGGDISVYSENGKGTTINVLLPVTDEEHRTARRLPAEIRGGDERVLLVDDEPQLAEMGKKMLEKIGYRVESNINSRDALETFRRDPRAFDVLVTDQTMPHMTGLELCEEIRKLRPGFPVVLCTGFSESIGEENYKAHGVDGFVMKPLMLRDIARTLRAVLNRGRRPRPVGESA